MSSEITPEPLPDQVVPAMSLLDGHSLLALSGTTSPGSLGSLASIGRFNVLRLLGAGGMGIVVLARDPNRNEDDPNSLVAIKILRLEFRNSALAVKRFITEATHMSRLDHPNILRVLETQSQNEPAFYVMPYLPAGPLSKVIDVDAGLPRERILQLALPVAQAIAFAHSRGIIHRDLKPANILLTDRGEPRVGDFGLVRTVYNDSIVDPSRDIQEGSAAYMSPAIVEGMAEDTRCDIYSFGATLYEMLTGRPPYEGRTAAEVMRKIRTGPPQPIQSVQPNADPNLARVSARCMERRLSDRYASMQDVVDDLERCAAGKRLAGRPRLSRRQVLLAGAATVAAATTGITWWRSRHSYNPSVIAVLEKGAGWSSHFSHDSKWVVHASKQSLFIRDAMTLKLVHEISGMPVVNAVLWYTDFTEDLRRIAFSTDVDEHSVRVADIASGRFLYEHGPGGPRQVRFSASGDQLAIAAAERGHLNAVVRVLDLDSGTFVREIVAELPVSNVYALSKWDGDYVLCATSLGLGIGRWRTGQFELLPSGTSTVNCMSERQGAAGSLQITGTIDGSVQFRRDHVVVRSIRAHDYGVSFVCLYAEGKYGRTVGGKIPQIISWDVEHTEISSRVDLGWMQSRHVAISPDGQLASICDELGRLLVIRLPTES